MGVSSRYWTIWTIDAASESNGYKCWSPSTAQEFFQRQFLDSNPSKKYLDQSERSDRDIQQLLLSSFRAIESSVDLTSRVLAGLCLRCYVSHPILRACKRLASLFSSGNQFTYRDLIQFVLNDDGKTRILLDGDGKTQLILNANGETQKLRYEFFAVEVLRTYSLNSESRLSLDNWAHYQTRQNQELRDFLSEWGFRSLSNWALLNKAGAKQLERLPQRDRHLVEVFHAVYRRDRRQQHRKGMGKCPEPTALQLNEMSLRLQERGVVTNTLLEALTEIADKLHQYEIWSRRGAPLAESLEVLDPETGNYVDRELDDPKSTNDLEELKYSELRESLPQRLMEALDRAIEQGLHEQVASIQKRRKYAPFASKVLPGFRLLYCQGKSQSEIARLLGMTNQTQVSRVLEPSKLLNKVRFLTVDKLFHTISDEITGLALDELNNLMQQLEAFVDGEIFQEATAEIHATRNTPHNRSTNSVYTQRLCRYLEDYQE